MGVGAETGSAVHKFFFFFSYSDSVSSFSTFRSFVCAAPAAVEEAEVPFWDGFKEDGFNLLKRKHFKWYRQKMVQPFKEIISNVLEKKKVDEGWNYPYVAAVATWTPGRLLNVYNSQFPSKLFWYNFSDKIFNPNYSDTGTSSWIQSLTFQKLWFPRWCTGKCWWTLTWREEEVTFWISFDDSHIAFLQ